MAFDPDSYIATKSQPKPVASFDPDEYLKSRAAQQPSSIQGQPKVEEDIFSGLPQATIDKIKADTALPEIAQSGSSAPPPLAGFSSTGAELSVADLPNNLLKKAAEIEKIRLVKPELAELIESTGGLEAFMVGAGQGFRTLGSAIGVSEQPEGVAKEAIQGLKGQRPVSFGAGEIAAESAPFIAAGPIAAGARTLGGRIAGSTALTAAEGATIAKGKGGSGSDIAKGALIGAAFGPAGELAIPIARRLAGVQQADDAAQALLKEPTKREIREGLSAAVPTTQELREASKAIYTEVDNLGVILSPAGISNFSSGITEAAKNLGFRKSPAGILRNKESASVMNLIDEVNAGDVKLVDIEDLRREAQSASSVASRAGNDKDAAISGAIVDSIDDFLSKVNTTNLSGGGVNIGSELATARQLWGRAKKAELLDLSVDDAGLMASGLENGIRLKFTSILKNKKQRRFFKAEELAAMRAVVDGTAGANFFKKLSKTGFGKGRQTNVLSGVAAVGAVSTLLGPITGALLAGAGRVSSNMAENLTKKNASMANEIIRAGANAEDITRAYLRGTPVSQRSAEDLSQLLMRPDVSLELVQSSIAIEAAALAKKSRLEQASTATAQAATAGTQPEEEL